MSRRPPLLTTAEVARRLGVKPATVYAYVSRGLLTSRRNADGKGSLFAQPDVDAFLAGRRRTTTPGIHTGITLISDGGLFYRGHDATALARSVPFEAVAELLWTGTLPPVPPGYLVAREPFVDGGPPEPDPAAPAFRPAAEMLAVARAAAATLPDPSRLTDRLRVIVAAAAAADPLRFDTSATAVLATGRALLATMIVALPYGTIPVDQSVREQTRESPLARSLWHRLTPQPPGEPDITALNAALVLLADHDIAASTLAARVAASTRAHPYAVVGAGLAALDGPLHGAASGFAYTMLTDALGRADPVTALAERQRAGLPVPGFGHPLYPDGDPRATTLLGLLHDGPVRDCALRLADAMTDRSGTHPNVDFALAALTRQHDMPADAGEAVFAVARTAGWLAHALEEYADRPLRFRPNGLYAGPPPERPR